ncbi:MAG TPA: ribosome biogenesis GTPase YlqF [Polyangiaceae bacterium]|nr:ribosome biogenesis GTPase YlqF [Polyangiaceae bacterium]
MSMQWFPGHMKQARRAMAEALPSNDVVIEVLDARMPISSSNPVLSKLRAQKPCIKLLGKTDLADPEITRAWVDHFASQAESQVVALLFSKDRAGEARARITELCRKLAPKRVQSARPVRVMVVGIPNVGKSTLINLLMERKVAKVSDQPGVTRAPQLVTLKTGLTLLDNAGILWPRIDTESVLRLSLGGALPEAEMDYETVAAFAAQFLSKHYPKRLAARLAIPELPSSSELVLEAIARKYGCLRKGGQFDWRRASEILVHEFRSGVFGRVSLETPADLAARELTAIGEAAMADATSPEVRDNEEPSEAPPTGFASTAHSVVTHDRVSDPKDEDPTPD